MLKVLNWVFQTLIKLAYSLVVGVIAVVAVIICAVMGIFFWPINKLIELYDRKIHA